VQNSPEGCYSCCCPAHLCRTLTLARTAGRRGSGLEESQGRKGQGAPPGWGDLPEETASGHLLLLLLRVVYARRVD
jgi:hypothetical protein